MSVFYKFSSAKDYDTISFSGGHISVADLKEKICEQKKLTNYDLLISNADTKQEYKKPDSLIPKNTVLKVRRAPPAKGFGPKKPVVPSSTESTKPTQFSTSRRDTSSLPGLSSSGESSSNIKDENASPMDENEKISNLVNASSSEWLPTRNTGRSFRGEQRGPGPNYVCHRCHRTGHYIQNCPTNGDPNFNPKRLKKATGIPRQMLRLVGKEESNGASLVLPDGMYAVMQPNEDAFAQAVGTYQTTSGKLNQIPKQLQCSICNQPLNDAVTVPCCGTNFCDECITKKLVEETEFTCPQCQKEGILLDSLTPNKSLREAVEDWKRSASSTSTLPQPPNSTFIYQNNNQSFGSTQQENQPSTSQQTLSTTPSTSQPIPSSVTESDITRHQPLKTSEPTSGSRPIPVVGPNTGKGKPFKASQRSATVTLTKGGTDGNIGKKSSRRGGRPNKEKQDRYHSSRTHPKQKGKVYNGQHYDQEKKERENEETSRDNTTHYRSKEHNNQSRQREKYHRPNDRDVKERHDKPRSRERPSSKGREREYHRSRSRRSHDRHEDKDRHRRRNRGSRERRRSSKEYKDGTESSPRDHDRKRKRSSVDDDKEEGERRHKRHRHSSPRRHDNSQFRNRKRSHSREERLDFNSSTKHSHSHNH